MNFGTLMQINSNSGPQDTYLTGNKIKILAVNKDTIYTISGMRIIAGR